MAKRKKRTARSLPKVLLLVETTNTQGMEILTGVRCYIEEHRPWSVYFQERAINSPHSQLDLDLGRRRDYRPKLHACYPQTI